MMEDKILEKNINKDVFLENKLLNEIEINQGKTLLESKPQNLIVMLSSRCNINCLMCDPVKRSWNFPVRAIKEIIGLFPYLEHIAWQGGEVFLLDYFEDILDEASRFPNLKQSINTNGLVLNEHWAEKIAQNRIDLAFSVDGVTREVYEYIRRGARFKDLLNGIRLINNIKEKYSKIYTSITSVIMKSNYKQLELLLDFAKDYKFNTLLLARIDGNFDSQENIFYHNNIEAQNYIKKTLPVISKRAKDYGIELINCLFQEQDFQRDVDYAAGEKGCSEVINSVSNNEIICYLPWRELVVDFLGVRPDCRCPLPAGNILEESLLDIWNNSIMQLYRKKLLAHEHVDFCRSECSSNVIPRKVLKGM